MSTGARSAHSLPALRVICAIGNGAGIISAMMTNREIADTFERVADMLAIRGDSFHRILAYRRAAESIRAVGRDLRAIYAEGALEEIPGIGATLAEKIAEMLETGRLAFYDRLAEEIPPELTDLLRVEGLGPKRARTVYDALQISSIEGLAEAAREGKLSALPGMGKKTEENILAAIEVLERHSDDRTPLGVAWPIAQEMIAELAALPGVTQAAVGGSLRRMQETIGDIDLLLAAPEADAIMETFVHLARVERILGQGPTKSSVVLLNGLQVDLRVLPAERWGTLLSYFTGNKEHNVRLRELAQKRGLTLNEHRFQPLDGGEEILCATEEEVYAMLDLPYIPPTLRQDRGEIEAAQAGRLPELIQEAQIIADLHVHTTWSDGKRSILEMARAARERGRKYIVVTDHSVSLGVANGLSIERLRAQAAEVRAADEEMGSDFRVLHGTEMEIRADGTLDYPDEVLAELDVVIASLHVGLSQPREQVTKRALAAIENPHVDILGHPTGRLLPDRPGADLDIDAVIAAAARTGTILEVNANPRRLDLRDSHVRQAVEAGVLLAIDTDAHREAEYDLLHYGVATAQRGWAGPENVVNVWPAEKLLAYVGRGP